MRTVTYPDWAEKYRGKGRTIRKVRNGYGLYQCTSVYVSGQKYPKSIQKYLGMITEKDGFIPKKSDKPDSSDLVEYGLSTLIFLNFKRDLQRSVFNGDQDLICTRLAIVYYLYHSFQPAFLGLTWLTCSDPKLYEIAGKAGSRNITMLSGVRAGRNGPFCAGRKRLISAERKGPIRQAHSFQMSNSVNC